MIILNLLMKIAVLYNIFFFGLFSVFQFPNMIKNKTAFDFVLFVLYFGNFLYWILKVEMVFNG